MTWPCFWVEETGQAAVSLRRYSADAPCSLGRSYHNAVVEIAREAIRRSPDGYIEATEVEPYLGRPEWPAACACGYQFADSDERQVNQDPIWRAPDGREWPSRALPPGAMFDAVWSRPWGIGPDGIALTVVLPPDRTDTDYRGHWWHVDGPARSPAPGGGTTVTPNAWSRTGDPRNPPTLSVTPSILTDSYHGYLTAGVLTDPI